MNDRQSLANRFLSWPLPESVCSDLCCTNPDYPHPRSGTNLLTVREAEQMVEHVFGEYMDLTADRIDRLAAENAGLKRDAERLEWVLDNCLYLPQSGQQAGIPLPENSRRAIDAAIAANKEKT